MKKKLLLFLLAIAFFSCEKSSDNYVCGTSNYANDLPWLRQIIEMAEEDKVNRKYDGNYMGKIYIESYRNTPVFFVEMSMGSGGVAGYVFHCDGAPEDFDNDPKEVELFFSSLSRQRLIYSNIPF